jgi:hypothetical protein
MSRGGGNIQSKKEEREIVTLILYIVRRTLSTDIPQDAADQDVF